MMSKIHYLEYKKNVTFETIILVSFCYSICLLDRDGVYEIHIKSLECSWNDYYQ